MTKILDLAITANLLDTPRLFTGIAEFSAVFINYLVYKRKKNGPAFVGMCILFVLIQVVFQILAGISPIEMWIPNMLIAFLLMYLELYLMLEVSFQECVIICIQSFLVAELAASFYRQVYVWYDLAFKGNVYISIIFMLIAYFIVLFTYYKIEKRLVKPDVVLEIKIKDILSAILAGVGTFSLSNLSFIWSNTPFSAPSSSVLYVRTLVDLGGALVLLTQKDRLYENVITNENAAINQLFRRQYEQYKLSIDNSEMLRKEIHDLKHYLIVLKNETSPEKKQEYLEELEQEIAIQESFQNTGNQVLDVILTNKSLQCKKKKITLNAMVDGDILGFMHVKDICALFGNLLDNAIEAVQQVEVADNRLITLNVKQKQNFVVVECVNYLETQLKIEDKSSLPLTTKKDKTVHGFGLKSITQIAEKYEGSMTLSQNNNWFTIKVLLSKG